MITADNRARICFIVCLTVSVIAGCTGSRLPPGETGTVSGKLTYNGQPVPKGTTIVFMEDPSGQVASGTVNDSGEYSLVMKGGTKVLCGTYRISVAAPAPTAGMSTEEAMKVSEKGKPTLTEEANKQIPQRYRNPESSETVFEIKPGAQVFDLDMKDS